MTDPATDVTPMIRGYWVSLAIRAAVELGVFDRTAEPLALAELAAECECDPSALARLARVLTDLGLVERDGDAVVRTARGATLAIGHDSALRDLVLMQTVVPNLRAWAQLSDSVRTGDAMFAAVNGVDPWEFLSANPDEETVFNAAMARRATAQLATLNAAGPLNGDLTVVDVGGGRGALLAALLATDSRLRGIVADRPDVAAEANATFASAGIGHRAHGVPTDFFVEVPSGGDVYLIGNVLHDWDDDEATTILATIAAAMTMDARLWIVEQVLDAPGRSPAQSRDLHLVDLHMLVMFGARERTLAEYDALARAAGFGSVTLRAADLNWNVLETRLGQAAESAAT